MANCYVGYLPHESGVAFSLLCFANLPLGLHEVVREAVPELSTKLPERRRLQPYLELPLQVPLVRHESFSICLKDIAEVHEEADLSCFQVLGLSRAMGGSR
eukprot:SAG31_NODE_3222_length_4523_cov_2.551085_6_plen_101_part_00